MRIAGLALLLGCVLIGSALAGEDKRVEAEALFARANRLMGLGQRNSGPYSLRGHFRLIFNQPVEGTLLKAVLGDGVWRREISFPGYSEIVVRDGDRKWVRRNTAFTPMRVTKLLTALQPDLKVNEKEKVEKITEQMVGATRARCVKLKTNEWHREVCIDAATGTLLRRKSSWLREQVDYEGYSSSGDKQFPMKMRVAEADKVVAEFWMDALSVDLPDKSLFDPIPDAAVWPTCDKPKPPVPISTPDPSYREAESRNGVQGIVFLQITIDEQGRTRDAAVTGSLTPGLDEEAKAAVLKWRFQPSMCGSTPIPVETNVEVFFRLGN